MAQPDIKTTEPEKEPEEAIDPQIAGSDAVQPETLDAKDGLASPARRLQHYLDTELGSQFGEDFIEGKWSVRRSFAFVAVTCTLFWVIVFFAVMQIS